MNKYKENVILIASAPYGYGKKIVTNRLNQMKRDHAELQNKLSKIKSSSRNYK
ncbi:hypothetical protein [Anoxybacteroides amylolyticum]|uniref:Uncharacterized protein n=1 Tax=Anoxybacteroides amylolyticum TaxID=294699 RepID=A0A160F2U9_9BACL|nr:MULTISPECIES: hypothetical protein [Anoxybacillus]ANB60578.1 hypothetical protein GFC30_2024 [Anoxybacillus amylolyticus]MCL6586053.1 hypothetical protein [Anoxybacillus sp.]